MQIAITGGTGFIGRALVKKLLSKNHQVRILTRKKPKNKLKNVSYCAISFDDVDSLATAVQDCDAIAHLAAALFCRSRKEFEKANVIATRNLVSACAKLENNPSKFVYISSLAAGGPADEPGKPRAEDMHESPVSYYGITKLQGEKELSELPPRVKTITLRPPIVYGKRDAGISTIAHWIKKGFMVNAGAKNSFFTFIYLDDLANAIMTAVENDNLAGKTYYVCDNSIYTWETYIRLICEALKVKMPVMINPHKKLLYVMGLAYEIITYITGGQPMFNRDKAKEALAGNWVCSSHKWEKDTNWTGWTPLKEGIKKTFE